jgi:hypothetical protein
MIEIELATCGVRLACYATQDTDGTLHVTLRDKFAGTSIKSVTFAGHGNAVLKEGPRKGLLPINYPAAKFLRSLNDAASQEDAESLIWSALGYGRQGARERFPSLHPGPARAFHCHLPRMNGDRREQDSKRHLYSKAEARAIQRANAAKHESYKRA